MTPTVPDGPDTDLDEAIDWFLAYPGELIKMDQGGGPSVQGERHAATIVRAVLARPAVARTEPPADDADRWTDLGDIAVKIEPAVPHLVDAAAPAMRMLLGRVERGQWTADDARDVLLDWPNRAAPAGDTAAPPGPWTAVHDLSVVAADGEQMAQAFDEPTALLIVNAVNAYRRRGSSPASTDGEA